MISDHDVDDFLEHFGVKGMKWGQRKERRTARIQRRVDRTMAVAKGKGSVGDRLLGMGATQKGAQRQLQRYANAQAKYESKVAAGKKQLNEKILNKTGAVKLQDIDFGVKGDAKAGLDRGQKVAVGIVAAYGALMVGKAIANR